MLCSDMQAQIVACFKPLDPEKIVVFGSHATGQADSYSDIDLIVVYETPKRFLDRLAELYERWSVPKAVDLIAYTPEEFSQMAEKNAFVQDALRHGKVIYERRSEGLPGEI